MIVRKVKWKPIELPLPRKIVNQEQYFIPGRTAEISVTIKDVKNPTTYPLGLLFGLYRRQIFIRA